MIRKRSMSRAKNIIIVIIALLTIGAIGAYGYIAEVHLFAAYGGQTAISPTNLVSSQSSEGENTMVTERKLVRYVTSPPLPGVPEKHVHQPLPAPSPTPGNTPSVLVPDYLPSGLSLQKVHTSRGGATTHYYVRGDGSLQNSLQIRVGGTVTPAGLPVSEGSAEEVNIQGADFGGQLIRGMWHQHQDGPVKWNPDVIVMLAFYRQNELVTLTGVPGSAWTKEELVQIASSLRPSS